MVQYYPRYMTEGLAEPQIIQDHTRQYWQENDIYQLFINDCIIPVYKTENGQATNELDPTATLIQVEVYREFKNWFKETFPGAKVPDSPTVKNELIAKLGKQSNKRWHGVRIVQQETTLANI
jgi:phage/plasmid-associated DNA primase